jgi:hypothetical protein
VSQSFHAAAGEHCDNRRDAHLFQLHDVRGCVAVLGLVSPLGANRAPAAGGHAIAGAWTLNNDLSDQPGRDQRDGGTDSGRRGGGRGPGGGGRRGGGGFGGGWGGRGGGRGAGATMNPDDMARMRDAMRDLTSPPSHLTIVETDSMIVITSADGRTTRLAPDGKKVKDDNTGIERKTKWDGEKLVTEISGLGPMGKATKPSPPIRTTISFESSCRWKAGARWAAARPRPVTQRRVADRERLRTSTTTTSTRSSAQISSSSSTPVTTNRTCVPRRSI